MNEEIMIDGVRYVRAEKHHEVDGMRYCIVRSYGAGVFCGYVKEKKECLNGVNVTLINSRRIFYWSGACSLSQLAIEGTKDIENCKIAMIVPEHFVADVIEIIPMTDEAAKMLQGSKVWKI
jgi:hypothetical protein